jgi:predicted amidohydrolase YtcJ
MGRDDREKGVLSRRKFIKSAAAGAAAAAGSTLLASTAKAARGPTVAQPVCGGAADTALVNGNFLTMDPNNPVVNALTIRDGRFAEVGYQGPLGACGKVIDVKGATVIPGLIDSHLHFIRDGLNPGHEVRIIELASSISELQQMISTRIQQLPAPAGEFVTCIGGWNRNGLAEQRLPTLAELDAAAPNNPVYLSETGGGGAGVTNTKGREFFQSKGVAVDPTSGTVSTSAAFIALRNARDAEGDPRVSSRQKSTVEAIDFVSSLGMTMVHDVGGNGGVAGNTSLFVDLKAYDQALTLWRQNNLNVRIRTFFYSDTDPGFSVAAARIMNNFNRVGDDVFRLLGVGERVNVSTTEPGFIDHCKFAAANGWTVQQHSSTQPEISLHVQAYQAGNAVNPIKDFRWSLTHVNSITDAQIQALISIGTGVTLQGTAYTSGTATGGNSGTPFRAILDQMNAAGIPAGGGSDATNVGALNPWLMMYFMITGKNNAGVVINNVRATPQSCTRMEALRMYTSGSAYFSFDDDRLGTIQAGKLADLAVLSANPLTVSEDQFKRIQSVLTMQGGKIVYANMS